MNVSLLNCKITIQKHIVQVDAIGNHTNTWTDWYSCHATVSGENSSAKGSESAEAGTVVDHAGIDFTVRYCQQVADLNTTEYRVLFGDGVYDLVGLDHMNYKRKSLKLRCRKARPDG